MVLSVVVVALMVATLAIFLYAVGVFFSRTSGDLEDCVQNLKKSPPRRRRLVSVSSELMARAEHWWMGCHCRAQNSRRVIHRLFIP
jgi:hypothetical protein